MDFPGLSVTPLFFGTHMLQFCAAQRTSSIANLSVASGTWTAANDALFLPIYVPFPYPVKRVWWINGTMEGTRIYSTSSTAGSGNSAPQYVTPTAFILNPGSYYFALALDNNTANRITGSTALSVGACRLSGLLKQTSAFPLPATMTPEAITASFYTYIGVTRTESGF
jgi:hypothetical protein